MAYNKHTWEPAEPITKTRMNAIENGIEDAHNGITGINSVIGDRGDNSNTIMTRLSNVETDAATAKSNAADALTRAAEADNKTTAGTNAWTQVNAATANHSPAYTNLDTRFTTDEQAINEARSIAQTAVDEIGLAHRASVTDDTLRQRFADIETLNETQKSQISNLIDDIKTAAQTQDTDYLNVALERLDSHINDVDDEVAEARGTRNDETARDSLLEHFADNEALISAAQSAANTANTDISQIKATLGITPSSTPSKTIATMITDAQTAAQNYTDSQITNNNTATKVEEIIGAHRTNLGNDPETGDPIEDTLDNRFDDIEERLDNLDNVETGVITGLDGRIDELETTINATETGLKARMTAAELAIHHEPNGEDDKGGLEERVDALESGLGTTKSHIEEIDTTLETIDTDLNDEQSGLKALLATANSNIGTNSENIEDLQSRMRTLEGAEYTETVVINDAEFVDGVPVIEDPSADLDYLIKNGNNYYYWKYINNAWKLISGGGSGSGNSSAVVTTTLPNASDANVNTDYFVGTESGKYIHYRFTSVNGTLQPIIIANYSDVEQENIKSYQVATIDIEGEDGITTYLDFYGFNYGVEKASEDIDPEDDEVYRLARLPLPKGGGGTDESTSYRIYGKVRGDSNIRMSYSDAQSNGITLNYGCTCYNYDGDSYDYRAISYTLAREGDSTSIVSDSVNSLDKDIYSAGQSVNITIPNIQKYCEKNTLNTFILTLSATPPPVEPGEDPIVIRNKTITVYITLVELELTSTFTDQKTYPTTSSLLIPYTFTGMNDITPEFTVTLDNNPINATITAANIVIRQQDLASLSGVHNLVIKASQMLGDTKIYSDPLNYQLGLVNGTSDSLMLFSGASIDPIYLTQYQTIKIPYYLYVPNNGTATVNYSAEQLIYNDAGLVIKRIDTPALAFSSETLSTGAHEYPIHILNMIEDTEYYTITISCASEILVFNIIATKADEEIYVRTDNLVFDFKPERFTNNAELDKRLWSETRNRVKYSMQIPEGAHFDWRTGGWITDDNDVPCFCVKAGSRVQFVQQTLGSDTVEPLTLFWPEMEEQGGSNFKCTFRIDNVKTPDAPFLTSLDKSTNTLINYGKTILASKQDIEDDETLLHTYLNTKYIYTKTINSSNKVVKEAIGDTVLNNEPFSTYITTEIRAAAEDAAREKNTKNIKKYIGNIYKIANQASVQEHREYLLKVLSGKEDTDTIDYGTISDEIEAYLMVLTNAQSVYDRLTSESNNTSTTTYAYRQVEPVNFDAMLNGFVVEGKDGKDGIIAMIQFTFVSEIKAGGGFDQTVSVTPISNNSFSGTSTFSVTVVDTQEEITKIYEVEVINDNGNYTTIKSIRDASDVQTRSYGLELNALGSNIYLPSGIVSYAHSEGDIIEFEYNINPAISGRINSSVIIYEDGVPSAAKLYPTGNNIFEQTTPGNLIIGSDECDVYIYKMRLYNAALSNEDILSNFYADGLTADEMMQRYNRNKTLVKASTITPQLVAQECPDLRIIMIETPNLTGGKTSFIKNTKVRCIYKNGRPEDNWVALNAYHAGQGTSSDNYGVAGRNLDIMFGFDGEDTVIIPKPQKNNYTFDPNYKSMLIKGLDKDTTNDILTAEQYEDAGYTVEYNGTGKVSLSPTSVPNNWFNIKVNIASSENTNNAFLQKRYDRYLPYNTPARLRGQGQNPQVDIKNDMEFFNCVVFIKETGTANEFTEDNNLAVEERPWHFYGIGNIGDSKKTDNTRANVIGDPYEFCIEISDNGLKNSGFNTGVFYISEASKNRSKPNEGYRLDTLQSNIANLNRELTTLQQSEQTDEILRQIATVQAEIARLTACIPEARGLTATTLYVCTNSEYTVNDSTYNININSPSSTTLYLIKENTYYRRFMYANGWFEVGEPITFERTSAGCKYPISHAEWETASNTYYSALYDLTSGKGWDKSFEFRYDITTKDGETVARNDLEAAMNSLHQLTNKRVFADMYSWIVTSSNTEFHDNLNEWFIEKSPLYWYLFTERYTMIDSRAKNTFYHYGKVYINENEANGTLVSQLQSAANNPAAYAAANGITASGNVTAEQIAAQEIAFRLASAQFIYDNAQYFTVDNDKAAINNGYRFELWDYDDDTALGINNNGQMVFSAGLEDIDKDVTGWIYNEAESVIWRRIRENMYSELGALYVNLKEQCFNAQNLITEFDNRQAEFPEELWRMDFERKYYRPFISKGETTYLNDMANGRKKYQRRQFERNMAIYINSKYQRNGSYESNDLISFRPQFDWRTGLDTTITIKPYSTMYINFALGNYDNTTDVVSNVNTALSKRVQRGEEYTIDVSDYIHEFRNIQCIIYNASRLMSLEGLGKFYCQQFILGAAKKLTTLILGNSDPAYTNYSMKEFDNLGLSDGLPLLETLDLQNIQFQNPPTSMALDSFPLLKNFNAAGCNIQSFTFKDGGMLEKIVFPDILTRIEFKNLYNLVDYYNEDEELVKAVELTGARNLISYNSINSYTNSWEIVQNMLNNAGISGITQLTLNDINWEIGNIVELLPLETLQNNLGTTKMSLEGHIKVTGTWSQVELDAYQALWPHVTFECTGTEAFKHRVEYKYDADTKNGESILILYVDDDSSLVDIVSTGAIDYTPSKPSTAENSYTFGTKTAAGAYQRLTGWRLEGSTIPLSQDTSISTVTRDLTIETNFIGAKRTYKIRWYMQRNDSRTFVKESSTQARYGEGMDIVSPTVSDIISANQSAATYTINGNILTYNIFDGWEETPVGFMPDGSTDYYNIYAKWKTGTVDYTMLDSDTKLTPEILFALSKSTNISNRTRVLSTYDPLEVTMGYEGFKEGIELVSIDNPKRFDAFTDASPVRAGASSSRPNGIQPFLDSSKPFTLAIDYRFHMDEIRTLSNKSESVLIGCEDRNIGTSVQSLKLFYDFGTDTPRIGFGDTLTGNGITQSKAIGNSDTVEYRNIVVICHPANATYIDVYCGYNGSVDASTNKIIGIVRDYSSPDMFRQRISWPNANKLNTSAPLVLGDRALNANQDTVIAGIGTIYWAKYWAEDLGAGECLQLASWPHEKTTFAIEDYNGMKQRVVSTAVSQPNIVLTTITASETCKLPINQSALTVGDVIGWNNSELQTYANGRIFNGLPITMQAIMAKSGVRYMTAECTYDNTWGNRYRVAGDPGTSYDKIFFPSYIELSNDTSSVYSFEATRGYVWSNDTTARVYQYTASGTSASEGTPNIDYSRLRFPMVPLSDEPKVYLYPSDQSKPLQERLYESNMLERGAIMILSNNPTTAYVYVTAEDILAGAPVVPNEGVFFCSSDYGGGGWVESTPYWIRSVYDDNAQKYPFMYVQANGHIYTQAPGFGTEGVLTCGLDYSISI